MKKISIFLLAFLPLSMIGGVHTIEEIQGHASSSPFVDSTVTFYGVVTAPFTYLSGGSTRYAFFVEMKPGGAWRGIYIYNGSSNPGVERGDSVRITGKVSEYYGVTEVSYPDEITVLGSTTPPDPVIDSTGNISDEKYEGVLVKVVKAACTQGVNAYGEWEVDDGSGPAIVDDRIFYFEPVVGDTYSVTGPVDYYYDYKILPRDDRDILEPGEIEGLYADCDPVQFFERVNFNLKFRVISTIDTVSYLRVFIPPEIIWSHNVGSIDLPSNDSAVVVSDSTGDTIKVFGTSIFDTVMIQVNNVIIDTTGTFTFRVEGSMDNNIFSVAGKPFIKIIAMPTITDLRDVQNPGPDGVTSGMLGDVVTVLGYAVTGNISPTGTGFYLNDTTSGVDIFSYDAIPVKRNYRYLIKGTVDEYNGLTEVKVNNPSDVTLISRWDPIFKPETLATSVGLDESTEGRLLCVKKSKVVTPLTPIAAGGGYNFTVANGQAYITIRLETGTGINVDSMRNMMGKGDIFTITGVGGQYDSHEPYTTGYQLLPRDMNDIVMEIPSETTEVLTCTITPNPFSYDLGEVADVKITAPHNSSITAKIFDAEGRLVKILVVNYPGGSYETYWNGEDEYDKKVTIGLYLIHIVVKETDGKTEKLTKPIIVGTKLGR